MPSIKKQSRGQTNFRLGIVAERLAGIYLLLKGYRIICYRYKTFVGEIDILVCKNGTLIAIEVKRRQYAQDAPFAILTHQMQRVRKALDVAHKHYPQFQHLRIDTILISPLKWPIHIKNAF